MNDLSDGDSELTELSRARVNEVIESSFLSAETLRLNGSIDPEIQNRVARKVYDLLADGDTTLIWRGFPKQPQLIASCELIVGEMAGPRLRDLGITSGREMAWHLNALGRAEGLVGYLRAVAEGARAGQSTSEKIDQALKVVRNVVSFQFPRDLTALNTIVSEIAERLEVARPDYGVYCEAAENLFLPWTIAALDEYGVPIQIAAKLAPYLNRRDLDVTLSELRQLDLSQIETLSQFERTLVSSVQTSI